MRVATLEKVVLVLILYNLPSLLVSCCIVKNTADYFERKRLAHSNPLFSNMVRIVVRPPIKNTVYKNTEPFRDVIVVCY